MNKVQAYQTPEDSTSSLEALRVAIAKRQHESPTYATDAVDLLLKTASRLAASDIHLQPSANGLEIRFRLDGVLVPVVTLPLIASSRVVARLKVLAELLTYRLDVPQEGRIRSVPGEIEMRVSVLPTLHGEKAVVRLFASSGHRESLDDLGLPLEIASTLKHLLEATSGAILLTGPAGAGKTTTIYACLRELIARSEGRRSLVTLEDPIEVALNGVSQTQVNNHAGLTMEVGLRALLRQDPEVIAIGEIRDKGTAEVAFQGAMTGHLVLSTFHSGNAASAIGRLLDMEIEPYLLRSGLLAIIAQRLVRKLCGCSRESLAVEDKLKLDVDCVRLAVGCEHCGGTGYHGRIVLAEMLVPQAADVGRAILSKTDVQTINQLAVANGMISLGIRALDAVRQGITSPAEIRRVFGIADFRPNQMINPDS